MIQCYPGKTLEELDGIDFGRHLRAHRAKSIMRIEEKRLIGIHNTDALTAEEWADVAAHDQLLERMNNGR